MNKNIPIGVQIAKLRKKRKLSQAQLAEISGISLIAICSIEQGVRNPNHKTINAICQALNCTYIETIKENL